jgi:hypothetical protein
MILANDSSQSVSQNTLILIAIITVCVPAFTSIILFILGQLFSERRQAADRLERLQLSGQLTDNTEITKKVEGLVNGLRTEALKDKVVDTLRIAELQPDAANQTRADMAKESLAQHISSLPDPEKPRDEAKP